MNILTCLAIAFLLGLPGAGCSHFAIPTAEEQIASFHWVDDSHYIRRYSSHYRTQGSEVAEIIVGGVLLTAAAAPLMILGTTAAAAAGVIPPPLP